MVGGEALISAKFDDALKGPLANYGPLRLKGLTKYDTALEIVNYFKQDTEKVYIATGVNFPDGLAGGALAAKTGSPLILIDRSEITPEVLSWLASIKGKNPQIYVLGGTGAISEANRELIEKTILP
jgi:putative cell wall-binding protein